MRPKVTSPLLTAIVCSAAIASLTSCKSGMTTYPSAPAGAKELDSGDLGPGAIYQHRFAVTGTYAYHCVHHSPMTGSVTVSAAAADTLASVSITSSTMSFPAASVKPGGRVVWTNNAGVLHTVTSD